MSVKPGSLLRPNLRRRQKSYSIETDSLTDAMDILPTEILLVLDILVEGDTAHGTGWVSGSTILKVLHRDQVRYVFGGHERYDKRVSMDFEEV